MVWYSDGKEADQSVSSAIAIAALLILASLVFYGIPFAHRRWATRVLRDRVRASRTLVLSYDDGPGPELTPRLLGLLARFDACATFLPLGQRAEAAPRVLDQVAAAGHEIGCHSTQHRHAWRTLPPQSTLDARAGFRSLARWAPPDGLYRPPHGKLDLLTWIWLGLRGARLAWWTLDAGDTWKVRPTPESVAQRLLEAGGGVVLLHDFDGTPERSEFVLETTGALLEAARREGLSVRALGPWLAEA